MAITSAFLLGSTTGIGITTSVWLTTSYVGMALTSLATSALLGALSPKPSSAGSDRGYQTNTSGTALDHQIIYGEVKVGGAILYDETTGSNNKLLHRIIGVAGHEIESFERIYINDEYIDVSDIPASGNVPLVYSSDGSETSDRYDGKITINFHLGSPTQEADSGLVTASSVWNEQCTLSGIAYMYIKMEYDQDAFPNGIPVFTTTIKGKKVKNPSTGVTSWSDNPALCLRDYLTTTSYGLGEIEANIDDDLVNTAVTVCNQTNTDAGTKRFTCNGSFTTGSTPYDTISRMLLSMGGTLWYAQGKWRMKPAYWTAPVMDLNEDDLRSSVSVSTRHSRRDNFNTIKGTFRGEETNWQVTDYPQRTSADFLAVDGGQESVADVDLSFTDTSVEARRLALITLERNRQQLTIGASFGLRTLGLQVGDNVRITNTRFGWDNKPFEVVSWNFGLTDGLDLQTEMSLRETAESVFDEVADDITYERDNTNLPSPFFVQPVGLSVTAVVQVSNQKVSNIAEIEVTATEDVYINKVEVQYKDISKPKWKDVGSGPLGTYEAVDLKVGFYDFRARAVNTFGVKGSWEYLLSQEINAFAGDPSDVSELNAEFSGGSVFLSWPPIPDADLSHYVVKQNSNTVGATWGNSTTVVEKIARPSTSISLPIRSGTFLIRAYDKEGNFSEGYTSVVVLPSDLPSLGVTELVTEDPTFAGSKTNVLLTSSTIEISNTSAASPVGEYFFDSIVDLGTVRDARVTGQRTFTRKYDNGTLLWDAVPQNFDTWPDLFDTWTDENAGFGDVGVTVYVSATYDNPTGSPTWGSYILANGGFVQGWGFRFKAVLNSTNTNYTPNVTKLSATVEY
tara:strand:+ start:248 stop:2797 length:2550 start_codon:yes stop_codon:yes gene_type:complete